MNKKIVFLDLDHTLYCHDIYGIPETAMEAILKARENGHLVVLCTGRNPSMSKIVDSSLFDAQIFSSGAYIMVDNKVIAEHYFNENEVSKIVSFFESERFEMNLETPEAVFMSEITYDMYCSNEHRDISPTANIKEIENLKKLIDFQNETVSKISIYTKEEKQIKELLNSLEERYDLIRGRGKRRGLYVAELCLENINKAFGIQTILDHFNLTVKQTIGIGDSMNDYEMIHYCHIGISVEDGDQELIKAADEICPSPMKDGIFHVFKKYGLLE